MLIPLGILASAGGVPPALPTYELIATTVLTGNASSVTFNSLDTYASDYRHLQVRFAGTMDTVNRWWSWQANGNTSSIYRTHQLLGDGGTCYSLNTLQNRAWLLYAHDNNSTLASVAGVVDYLDAFSTTKNKVSRGFAGTANGSSQQGVALSSGFFPSTDAISSLTFLLSDSGNFRSGTRFSIYGVRG